MTRTIYYARLKQEMIAEYERLHDNIPAANLKNMRLAGFKILNIYRLDDILVMLMEKTKPDDPIPPDQYDSSVDEAWHRLTDVCFAEPWQQMPKIFTFDVDQSSEKG